LDVKVSSLLDSVHYVYLLAFSLACWSLRTFFTIFCSSTRKARTMDPRYEAARGSPNPVQQQHGSTLSPPDGTLHHPSHVQGAQGTHRSRTHAWHIDPPYIRCTVFLFLAMRPFFMSVGRTWGICRSG